MTEFPGYTVPTFVLDEMVVANQAANGGLFIRRTAMSPAEGLALAAWIIATFGEADAKETP